MLAWTSGVASGASPSMIVSAWSARTERRQSPGAEAPVVVSMMPTKRPLFAPVSTRRISSRSPVLVRT